MFLLKLQWELFGLRAPAFSWVVAFGLIAYSIYVFIKHRRESVYLQKVLYVAEHRLEDLANIEPFRAGKGISGLLYGSISQAFSDLAPLRIAWHHISSLMVARKDSDGEERFWLSEDLGDSFNHMDLGENQSYKTAPTVISGIGLLATFLAILVALLDVRITGNKVHGLGLLVQGLSGKFLSSVVALGCATALVFGEKWIARPVDEAILSITTTLKGLLPRLAHTQVLLDMHEEIRGQSKALQSFTTDFTGAIIRGFSDSVGPTMERMAVTIDDLGRHIKENGSAQQTSNDDRLADLFKDFGASLEPSFERMASNLGNTLTDSTQAQFTQISEALANSASMLQQTNNQLTSSGSAIADLINLAKNATPHEIEARQAQIDLLMGTVGQLMTKLEEKSGQSMGSMEKALAAITAQVSGKVMELSTQVATMMEETSLKSAGQAKEVLDQVGSLSSRSVEQLVRILEKHSAELTKVEDLRTLLDGTLKSFNDTVGAYGQVTDSMQKLTSQMNMGVASLGQIAKSMKEGQEAGLRVSTTASSQIESLKGFTESQHEIWERVQTSMTEYEKVFERVEGHAKDLLDHVADHLGGYSDTTQKHFVQLTTAADNFISQATGKLAVSIEELGEQLDELHNTVAGLSRPTRAAG